jgi:NAD+ diphosphatase
MFSSSSIDRCSHIRVDEARIQQLLESKQSLTLVWYQGKFIMQSELPRFFAYEELSPLQQDLTDPVYLGRHEGRELFACQLKQLDSHFSDNDAMSLRSASFKVSPDHLAILFYAQGMLNWLQNHSFCSRCGSDTTIIEAGHGRRCNNAQCARVAYPKIDPAVIFSIVNDIGPESKILLGRKSIWDENRYSVIAGFVEPGETLEDAVRREAYEETGVKVESIEYIGSQPWPFPDSLMLGFSALTSDHEITLIDQELEKAAWFTASEIEEGVKTQMFKMPFRISIAWHLIDRWFTAQKGYSVATVDIKE